MVKKSYIVKSVCFYEILVNDLLFIFKHERKHVIMNQRELGAAEFSKYYDINCIRIRLFLT